MPDPDQDFDFDDVLAFCRACEHIQFNDGEYDPAEAEWRCPQCDERMIPARRFDRNLQATVKFIVWARGVRERGMGGPSPGGAANELECSRSMVDKLVNMGILERSEYGENGHKVVMISSRSIERAKKAKRQDGKWTDAGVIDEGDKS